MEKKILLIVNPVAGRGKIKNNIDTIKKNLEDSGCSVNIEYTSLENNAENIIRNKKNETIDTIIAIGGDGTLNEVVNGIIKNDMKVKIGFIPLGTTNDFAKTLNIPINKYKLSEKIKNLKQKECDTGVFNGKYFNYVSAFGPFAKTSYNTSRKEKNYFGRLAYIVNGTKDFLEENNDYYLKIETDTEKIEGNFVYGSISNSKYIGGFRFFNDDEIDIGDGKFELILIKKQKNKAKLLKTYIKLINQQRDENVIYLKTSKLKIESDKQMNWSLDGELEHINNEIKIENISKNIEFLTI